MVKTQEIDSFVMNFKLFCKPVFLLLLLYFSIRTFLNYDEII